MKRYLAGMSYFILIATAMTASCSKDSGTAGSAAAQKQSVETLVIPDGTVVAASLDRQLSTKTNHTGDMFSATTTEPIMVDGKTAILAGAAINGVLHDVEASDRVSGRAKMTLAYVNIVDVQGVAHPFSATPLTLQAAATTNGDQEKIAAGGILGGVTGGIIGGGKSAVIGAGAGTGAGTILMLATKGEDLELNPGQMLAMHMMGSMNVLIKAAK